MYAQKSNVFPPFTLPSLTGELIHDGPPTFVPYITQGRRIEKGSVDVGAILPVKVRQTTSSGRQWQEYREARSIAGSKVRLTKLCMDELIEFCKVRRPELYLPTSEEEGEQHPRHAHVQLLRPQRKN
jgi:hypothetical protein